MTALITLLEILMYNTVILLICLILLVTGATVARRCNVNAAHRHWGSGRNLTYKIETNRLLKYWIR